MRDPDLVLRAQRAAVALERAWDRYRTSHGLGADPMPAISSYVGYSLEEPWGEPRVVFGVAADEAELLAVLFETHECAGASETGSAPSQAQPSQAQPSQAQPSQAQPSRAPAASQSVGPAGGSALTTASGPLHVPVQSPSAAKRGRAKEQARPGGRGNTEHPRSTDRASALDSGSVMEAGGVLESGGVLDSGGVLESGGALESGSRPGSGRADRGSVRDPEPPAASGSAAQAPGLHVGSGSYPAGSRPDLDRLDEARSRTGGAELMAFRPRHEPASYLDDPSGADPFPDEPDDRRPAGRGGRLAGSHALPRQIRPDLPLPATRPGQAANGPRPSGLGSGSGRRGAVHLSAEFAGWAASELPGQASRSLAPNLPAPRYGPMSDSAALPNASRPSDGIF